MPPCDEISSSWRRSKIDEVKMAGNGLGVATYYIHMQETSLYICVTAWLLLISTIPPSSNANNNENNHSII